MFRGRIEVKEVGKFETRKLWKRLFALVVQIWGHLRSPIYETPLETEENLVARILSARGTVQNTPGI
jgi:hypothetical protein